MKKNIFLVVLLNIVLLILYTCSWYFEDTLLSFVLFIIGLMVFSANNLLAIYWVWAKRNFEAISILLISSLFFILPLKSFYMRCDYSYNMRERISIVDKYKNHKLKRVKVIFGELVQYKNNSSSYVYAYKDCVMFPVFSYEQAILHCQSDEKKFTEKFGYKKIKTLDTNWHWVQLD